MGEQMKNFPSLPSNYVTLQQLQEKRSKEQHRRQKEMEEKEKKFQQSLQAVEAKSTDRPLPERRRNAPKQPRKRDKVAEQNIAENIFEWKKEIEENVLDREQKVGESKRKRKRRNSRKQKSNENVVGYPADAPPESGEREKVPNASPSKPAGKKIQIRLQSKRENPPVKMDPKPQLNRTADIAEKFGDLTFDDGKRLKSDGGQKRYERSTAKNRDDSRNRFSTGKPESTGMVWVRKRDIADNISTGSRPDPSVFPIRRK